MRLFTRLLRLAQIRPALSGPDPLLQRCALAPAELAAADIEHFGGVPSGRRSTLISPAIADHCGHHACGIRRWYFLAGADYMSVPLNMLHQVSSIAKVGHIENSRRGVPVPTTTLERHATFAS